MTLSPGYVEECLLLAAKATFPLFKHKSVALPLRSAGPATFLPLRT